MINKKYFWIISVFIIVVLLVVISVLIFRLSKSDKTSSVDPIQDTTKQIIENQNQIQKILENSSPNDQTNSAIIENIKDTIVSREQTTSNTVNSQPNTNIFQDDLPVIIDESIVTRINNTSQYSVKNSTKLEEYKLTSLQNKATIYRVPKSDISKKILEQFDFTQLTMGDKQNKNSNYAILIFDEVTQRLEYAGHDVNFLFDYQVKSENYWFFTKNFQGADLLFVSKPNFIESKLIEGYPEPDFISEIKKTGTDGGFDLVIETGNGESATQKISINLANTFNQPQQNIVTNKEIVDEPEMYR